MIRVFGACALLVPLAGCGLPTPISVASLVLDVGSYAVAGKTTTDLALSALTGEDCAVVRVLEGDPCSSPDDYELALGVLEPLPDETDALPTPKPLIDLQTAQVGVSDLEPEPRFVAEGAGLSGFLADDAAPGLALARGGVPLQLGSAGFLSDDLRPDGGAPAATQLGAAGPLGPGTAPRTGG